MILRTFGWAFGFTVVGLTAALIYGGPEALAICAILGVLEISLSFDNAVVNASVLQRMNPFWQKMFLTVGIVIAVFGMRLLFPLLIVGVTASLSPVEAVRLALDDGERYGDLLRDAHPAIAAFGGMFLFVLFLDYIFEEHDFPWLAWIERPLAKIGRLDQLSVVVSMTALVLTTEFFAPEDERLTVLLSGVLGLITYILVNGLGELFAVAGDDDEELLDPDEREADLPPRTGSATASVVLQSGRAAFFLFLYLEVLDASFSFDGVIGAFAITSDPIVIALGLAIGAFYIRSLTVYLVRKGTLDDYVYLESGAHWAIGALAILLLVSIEHEIPEVVTGLIGVAFIAAAFWSSIARNRSLAKDEAAGPGVSGDRVDAGV